MSSESECDIVTPFWSSAMQPPWTIRSVPISKLRLDFFICPRLFSNSFKKDFVRLIRIQIMAVNLNHKDRVATLHHQCSGRGCLTKFRTSI